MGVFESKPLDDKEFEKWLPLYFKWGNGTSVERLKPPSHEKRGWDLFFTQRPARCPLRSDSIEPSSSEPHRPVLKQKATERERATRDAGTQMPAERWYQGNS